ncbi:hypothetical protein KKD19_06550 [Patescibacteria group bacterium]|nr:hypothetical protein [Patescibacteria group bacterium]
MSVISKDYGFLVVNFSPFFKVTFRTSSLKDFFMNWDVDLWRTGEVWRVSCSFCIYRSHRLYFEVAFPDVLMPGGYPKRVWSFWVRQPQYWGSWIFQPIWS